MVLGLQAAQQIDVTTPLGALIAHFNASTKSVQKAFTRLMVDQLEKEEQAKLQAKVEAGERAIRNGQGISRLEGESTAQFFDRLCTE